MENKYLTKKLTVCQHCKVEVERAVSRAHLPATCFECGKKQLQVNYIKHAIKKKKKHEYYLKNKDKYITRALARYRRKRGK